MNYDLKVSTYPKVLYGGFGKVTVTVVRAEDMNTGVFAERHSYRSEHANRQAAIVELERLLHVREEIAHAVMQAQVC